MNLKQGITLQLQVQQMESGGYVASDSWGVAYGTGETVVEAVQDYWDSVGEARELLEEDEVILGPGLQEQLATIRRCWE